MFSSNEIFNTILLPFLITNQSKRKEVIRRDFSPYNHYFTKGQILLQIKKLNKLSEDLSRLFVILFPEIKTKELVSPFKDSHCFIR